MEDVARSLRDWLRIEQRVPGLHLKEFARSDPLRRSHDLGQRWLENLTKVADPEDDSAA